MVGGVCIVSKSLDISECILSDDLAACESCCITSAASFLLTFLDPGFGLVETDLEVEFEDEAIGGEDIIDVSSSSSLRSSYTAEED